MALLILVSGENVPEADLNIKSRDYEPINPSNIDVRNTARTPPPTKSGENWLFGSSYPLKIYKHPKTGALQPYRTLKKKRPRLSRKSLSAFGLAFTSYINSRLGCSPECDRLSTGRLHTNGIRILLHPPCLRI